MAHGAHYPDTGRLPDVLPIFPLPGALLLPGGQLPLNIFEPRYLAMILDAMAAGRVIGMIQPTPVAGEAPADPDLRDAPAVYPVGCMGRIINFAETGDGRLLITLLGQARFRVAEELPLHGGYRRVRPDFSDYKDDLDDDAAVAYDRDRLVAAAARFFDARGLKADWSSIEDAPDNLLVTSLAMVCPFDLREKQALLESDGPAARAALLTDLLEMSALGMTPDPGGAAH
ncbi:MAG: peptidase S16 [Rhodospirillaceae bacterium]|nr:peptidase S16 [Magnetovibrio sp.]MAY67149.1 peptidase S16 [Rhodospirillaceae bacterium]|tara:strand:+ start:57 stop:743 length:687 start_codon:yes stop_codon:yes gene_type:complete